MTDQNTTDTDDADEFDSVEKHIRTDTGCSTKVDVTRGSDTRDQEKWTIKAKGETYDEMREMFERQVADLLNGDGAKLRSFDPDEVGDE